MKEQKDNIHNNILNNGYAEISTIKIKHKGLIRFWNQFSEIIEYFTFERKYSTK